MKNATSDGTARSVSLEVTALEVSYALEAEARPVAQVPAPWLTRYMRGALDRAEGNLKVALEALLLAATLPAGEPSDGDPFADRG